MSERLNEILLNLGLFSDGKIFMEPTASNFLKGLIEIEDILETKIQDGEFETEEQFEQTLYLTVQKYVNGQTPMRIANIFTQFGMYQDAALVGSPVDFPSSRYDRRLYIFFYESVLWFSARILELLLKPSSEFIGYEYSEEGLAEFEAEREYNREIGNI